MLSRKIRTQIDRGRDAPVLQIPISPASQPTATTRGADEGHVMRRSPNIALTPVSKPQARAATMEPDEIRRRFCCSKCGVPNHNIFQCPSLPCKYCGILGHVSANCKVRQGLRKENRRRKQKEIRAQQAPTNARRKYSGGSHRSRESPAIWKVSASKTPRTAANRPAQIKVKKTVEMPKFHYQQRPELEEEPYIQDPKEEMAEDMEGVQGDGGDNCEGSDQ